MLGKILGGNLVAPIADSASEYGQERERTKQWKERARAQVEIAAASWRPALARALGGAVILNVLIAAVLLLTWLYGTVTQSVWRDEMRGLWDVWLAYASELFLLCTTFLTGYGVARSVFDKSGSDEPIRERLAGVFRSPKKAVDEEVERLQMRDVPSEIDRLPETPVNQAIQPIATKLHDWKWSERSRRRLNRSHEDLQRLFEWLLPRSPYDLTITETTRSIERQRENVKRGVSKTMNSAHLRIPSYAVDFAVIIDGKANWDIEKYREVTDIAKVGADLLQIPITCGIDWKTLVDGPHIELSRDHYDYPALDRADIVLS